MMKKLLFSAAAALFIVSCTQVDIDDSIVKDPFSGESITLSVKSTSSPETRVALGYDSEGEISVTWLEDDNLGAWWNDASSLSKFEMVGGSLSEDSTLAEFSGDVTESTIRLIHPYVDSAVVSNCLEISLAEQSVDMSGDGFNNMGASTYMISSAFDLPLEDESDEIMLQHVGSIIKIGMRFSNLPTSEDGEEPITYTLSRVDIGDELANGGEIDLSCDLTDELFYNTTIGSVTARVENSPAIVEYTEENEATYYLPINILPCTVEAGGEVPLMVYIIGSNGYTYYQFFTIAVTEDVEFKRATYNSVNYNCDMSEAYEYQTTWEDFAASSFAGGSGTESDPYQIATAEQMAYFALQFNNNSGVPMSMAPPSQSSTKYYTLTDDVDLLDRQWIYISNNFTGVFDGAGHTISGLYMSYPDESCVGLFPYTSSSAVIKNLLVDGFVEGDDSVGGIVGSNDGEIFQCGFSGETKGYYEGGNIYLGGLIGSNDGTISNSYNLATVTYALDETDDSYIGGITGINDGSVYLCYNGGVITTNGTSDYAGAIVGCDYGTTTACVASVAPAATDYGVNGTVVSSAAEAVEALNATVDTEYGYNKWMVSGESAVLDFGSFSSADPGWKEYAASSFAGGRGSESNPYQIATAEQLAYMAVQINKGNGYYDTYLELTADIDLSGMQWVYMTENFNGYFDGAGHTISGLEMDYPTSSRVGLFGCVGYTATVKNLIVEGSVRGYNVVGGIAGRANNVLESCGFIGTVTAVGGTDEDTTYYAGGVAALNFGSITNVYSLAEVSCENGESVIGGVVALNRDSMSICYNGGTGDICGENVNGDPTYSYSKGDDTAEAIVEALNAQANTIFELYCWTLSEDEQDAVVDFDTVSSAVGSWLNYPANSYAGGNGSESSPYQIATDEQMALLLKEVDSSSSYNYYQLTADIDLSAYEWDETSIYFLGTLDGAGYTISGLKLSSSDKGALFENIYDMAVIKNLYLDVDITSSSYAAGIAIYNHGTIINCGVSGSIKSLGVGEEDTYDIGSIAAINQSDGTISNSFSVAEVTYAGSEPFAGGIVGDNNGSVNLCYFAGGLINDSATNPHVGAIAGYLFGTAENCYSTTTGDDNGYNGTQVSDMQTLLSSLNEGVNDIYGAYFWEISSQSYPTFSNQLSSAEYIPAKWDDNVATAFASGSGTSEDPYMIATATQLAYLGQLIDAGSTNGAYYALACDVDLKYIPWITYDYADTFNGYFDGNGYTVTGFYTSGGSDYQYVSLLGTLAEGYKVSNLNVVGNLTVGGSSVSNAQGGGLINRNYGTVINCSFGGSITADTNDDNYAFAGGVVRINQTTGKVYNCYNSATITNNDTSSGQGTAGVVASNIGSVMLCYNVGVISGGKDSYRGAISSANTAYYSFTLDNGTYCDGTWDSGDDGFHVRRYDEEEGYMKSEDFVTLLNSLVDTLIASEKIDADCCKWSLGSGDYLYPVLNNVESADVRQ